MTIDNFCQAYRELESRARAGEVLTHEICEAAVAADVPTRKAFEEITKLALAGNDLTLDEFAARVRMPTEFAAALLAAFASGRAIAARPADAITANSVTIH
jgi:hypothetical protein